MPETAVDKDDLPTPREDQIRRFRERLWVQAITKTHSMDRTSYDQFGLRVFASDTRHQDASLFFRQFIHQRADKKTL
jgi:hypothetical protein